MKQQGLNKCWIEGKGAINGWCSIPSTITAEIMSLNKFDSITIDLQHGLIDYQTALNMLQTLSKIEITPMVRVPWNEPGIIMKLLDAGSLGVICPMINNKEDALKFVGATKYVPDGFRSSGPTRALMVHGGDYHDEANDKIISLAMVETEEALENVDEIASTNGLTGIYIGPSDLSISLGLKPGLDRTEEKIVQAIDKIKLACKKHNIKVGIHCLSPEFLKNKIKEGFDLTTLASDVRFFTEMVSKKIQEARG